jgi:hypothetical protein
MQPRIVPALRDASVEAHLRQIPPTLQRDGASKSGYAVGGGGDAECITRGGEEVLARRTPLGALRRCQRGL